MEQARILALGNSSGPVLNEIQRNVKIDLGDVNMSFLILSHMFVYLWFLIEFADENQSYFSLELHLLSERYHHLPNVHAEKLYSSASLYYFPNQ